MVLHGENGEMLVSHSLGGLIIQIDLGQLHLLGVKGRRVDTEPVVLGGDHDPPCLNLFDRLVRAPVAEFQLEGSTSQGKAEELVAQANAKDRSLPEKLSNRL